MKFVLDWGGSIGAQELWHWRRDRLRKKKTKVKLIQEVKSSLEWLQMHLAWYGVFSV